MSLRSKAAALAVIILALVAAFACPAIAIYATSHARDPMRFACALLLIVFVLSMRGRHGD